METDPYDDERYSLLNDRKRLEFMISHSAWIAWTNDGELCRVFHREEDGECSPIEGWGKPFHHDPRDAIDVARSAIEKATKTA